MWNFNCSVELLWQTRTEFEAGQIVETKLHLYLGHLIALFE